MLITLILIFCQRAKDLFNQMQNEFGANNCHFLDINSYNAEDSPNHVPDVWTPLMNLLVRNPPPPLMVLNPPPSFHGTLPLEEPAGTQPPLP